MRVGFPGGPRLTWYDRNGIDATIAYSGGAVAPHVVTLRATYTVPTGKKAFLGACCININRDAIATTLGLVFAYLSFAGSQSLYVSHENNTVGHAERGSVNVNGVLLAGQTAQLSTGDGSTGGTMDLMISLVVMEFDA